MDFHSQSIAPNPHVRERRREKEEEKERGEIQILTQLSNESKEAILKEAGFFLFLKNNE